MFYESRITMPKDLKIGLLLGFLLVAFLTLWISIKNNQTRFLKQQNIAIDQQVRFAAEPTDRKTQDTTEPESAKDDSMQVQQKYHTVLDGETLFDISRKYYSSGNKWQKIRDANPDKIRNVKKLKPGMKLLIPE